MKRRTFIKSTIGGALVGAALAIGVRVEEPVRRLGTRYVGDRMTASEIMHRLVQPASFEDWWVEQFRKNWEAAIVEEYGLNVEGVQLELNR